MCTHNYKISYCYMYLQVIAEGANGPTTIAAEKILRDKNVLVIPVSLYHTCTYICIYM